MRREGWECARTECIVRLWTEQGPVCRCQHYGTQVPACLPLAPPPALRGIGGCLIKDKKKLMQLHKSLVAALTDVGALVQRLNCPPI